MHNALRNICLHDGRLQQLGEPLLGVSGHVVVDLLLDQLASALVH